MDEEFAPFPMGRALVLSALLWGVIGFAVYFLWW